MLFLLFRSFCYNLLNCWPICNACTDDDDDDDDDDGGGGGGGDGDGGGGGSVYEYPDYVQLMSYPFSLKVSCTTSLQDEIVNAAKSGFCPSTSEPCVFQFVANCFDSSDPQVNLLSQLPLCQLVQWLN